MKRMDKKQFFNGTKLNQLNKQLADIETGWDSKRAIYLEHTSFKQVDEARGRRNNVSSVVQLQTKLIECEAVFFKKSRRGTPTLYVSAKAGTEHGFGARQSVLLTYKDSKGRRNSTELYRSWDADKFEANFISGIHVAHPRMKEVSLSAKWRYERIVRNRLKELLYGEMHDLERGTIDENLSTAFQKHGITLVSARAFTFRQWLFGVKYVKQNGLNFELGLENTSTYCSLPEVFKVTIRREIQFIPLSDLKVEKSGYYNHSESLAIKPEQLKQVKAFRSSFNRNAKGN